MPELPEVHTISNELNKKVSGERIIDYWTDWPKSIKTSSLKKFKEGLIGLKINKVERLGKNIIFSLSDNKILLVHQKMTGHLMVGRWSVERIKKEWLVAAEKEGPLKEKVNQYIHSIFYLEKGEMIALSDMRKFAKIIFGRRDEILNLPEIKNLGPDALDKKLTLNKFKERIIKRKKAIKLVLMDPAVIAGIGNIYADEILWAARVHPLKNSNKLNGEEIKRIFKWTERILKKAIKLRGSSVGDYRDASGKPGDYANYILAYRRTGDPCKRCGTKIKRVKAGQRSAHFCPQCQKV